MKWKIGLLVTMTLVSGCVSGGNGRTSCAGFKPILFSGASIDALTDAEVAEVLAHNEFGAARCGW